MAVIVGHRGVAGHAPENTLAGFTRAIELGLTHVELDVRLTKDGVPVVHHDASVVKLTHGSEPLRELTLAEVKALPVAEGRSVPSLDAVLDLVDGKLGLLIDLKSANALQPVLDRIEARGIARAVLLASFDSQVLCEVKRRTPEVKTCLLFRHPVGFFFRRNERRLWAAVESCGCEYIGPRASVVTRELVERAHTVGRKVYAYHVNARRGPRMLAWGVDAIGTDRPEQLDLTGAGTHNEKSHRA